MEMTADPTPDFVMMMIPHHQSAKDMVQVLINADQQKEIDQFHAWLEKHKQ